MKLYTEMNTSELGEEMVRLDFLCKTACKMLESNSQLNIEYGIKGEISDSLFDAYQFYNRQYTRVSERYHNMMLNQLTGEK